MKQDRASKQCSALALYHIWIGKLVCLSIYDIEYSTKGAFDTLIQRSKEKNIRITQSSFFIFHSSSPFLIPLIFFSTCFLGIII